jgi:hypothetical protein
MTLDLKKDYVGFVIDSNDPERLGRCKVRVLGVYDNVSNEDLPWSFYQGSNVFAGGESKGGGSISIPKPGTAVKVMFMNEDIHNPVWCSVIHLNDKLRRELSETYQDSHVIVYDEDQDLKIWFTPSNGMQVYYKDSSISINPDQSILIDHKESQSNIELKAGQITVNARSKVEVNSPNVHVNGGLTELGTSPEFSVLLGEVLLAALDTLAATVDLKWPPSPGVATATMQQARSALSKTVKTTA